MIIQTTGADWNQRILANPDGEHFLQSQNWGEFKAHWGWQPQRLVHRLSAGEVAVQYLVRTIPFLGSEASEAFMIKVDPELAASDDNAARLRAAGLVKAPADLQFKATIFIDLRPDEQRILTSFKQKTRYNVRLAMKKGWW